MKLRTALLATVGCALVACAGSISVSAQDAVRPAAATPRPPRPPQPPRSTLKHLLYIATPGGGEAGTMSGIVVLDADHDYSFVKRIPYDLPAAQLPMGQGRETTGISASVPENKLYITTDGGDIWAYDLGTDKMAWDFRDPKTDAELAVHPQGGHKFACCERPWTLPGGEVLLVGGSTKPWWYYVDAKTGKEIYRVDTPMTTSSHNLVVSEDGKIGLLGSVSGPANNKAGVAVLDVPNKKVLRYITFSDAVRPLTTNWDGSLVYANVNALDGFEIAESATGKVIKRVELPEDLWKAKWDNPNGYKFGHGQPSHGIGITPDGSEIWVTDGANDAWQVWDNSADGRNPVWNPRKTVKILNPGIASAWIEMTNDGKLAFTGDGTIIDVRAHKAIGTLKDEYGHPMYATEKMLYLTFDNGKLVETNNQFAMSMKAPTLARLGTAGQKQASN